MPVGGIGEAFRHSEEESRLVWTVTGQIVDVRRYNDKTGREVTQVRLFDMGLDLKLSTAQPEIARSLGPVGSWVTIPVTVDLASYPGQPPRLDCKPLQPAQPAQGRTAVLSGAVPAGANGR